MPILSQRCIRLALVYFLAGTGLGAVRLAAPTWHPDLPWSALHAELLLSGFVLQLTMAVAYWILPRRGPLVGRGRPTAARGALTAVNLGLAMDLWAIGANAEGWLVAGRALSALSVLLFVIHAWPRIRVPERERHRRARA